MVKFNFAYSTLSPMSIIYLLGAVQSLFFVVLVLSKKEKYSSDYLLVCWLTAMGAQLISYYVFHEEMYGSWLVWPALLILPPLIYAHGPLLYLYTLSLVHRKYSFELKNLLHFIPLFASLFYYLYLMVFKSNGDAGYFVSRPVVSEYLSITFYLLNIFLNPIYVVIVLFKLADHQQKIKMNFSYVEKINLNWLKLLAIGLGSVSLIVWIVHIISNFNIIQNNFSRDSWIFLSVTIFVFVAGYFGFKQGVIYKISPQAETVHNSELFLKNKSLEELSWKHIQDKKKYEKSQLSPEQAKDIFQRLNKFVLEEKAFARSELSLDEVASAIDVSSHTLSQLLNVFLKMNFFNYVNEQRVNFVKQMLIDSDFDKFSLMGIAEEAGFNSKSSFNRIFKNETGMTPSQYNLIH